MAGYQDLINLILQGEIGSVDGVVNDLLKKGEAPQDIISNGITPAMEIIGERYSAGEIFIPEMIVAARASQRSLELLKPSLSGKESQAVGKVVIGTVKGDLHDIGKNIVTMMLKSAGFEVLDLGVDATPEKFIAGIREIKPDIVCFSSLLTTTSESMRETIAKIKENKLRDRLKIMIGGPPTSQDYARDIGADYYGENAFIATQIAKSIVKSN